MRAILPLLVASIVAGSCLAGAASRLPALKAERWVNSAPLTPEGLRGKVVLVDIWEPLRPPRTAGQAMGW